MNQFQGWTRLSCVELTKTSPKIRDAYGKQISISIACATDEENLRKLRIALK